ncbi:uncharacterized protein JCM15063_004755 [Sporobolomyces koalae]|uniref:uncharacterized protein n=1 Tax=Sporobolomyces koalae TaxID=500713 RepID=UPI00317546AA
MPPLESTETEYNVHLTGFGPFHHVPVNPSWEAVQQLDNTTVPQGSDSTGATRHSGSRDAPAAQRSIRFSSSLLPVKYAAVLSQIPTLHSSTHTTTTTSSGKSPDLIIHVGVGLEGRIRIESRARKWGYNQLDVEGHLAPLDDGENQRGFAGNEWIELQEGLETTINIDTVVEAAKRRGVQHIETSRDAGLYLCEFTYYASLACALKHNSVDPTPVLFVHVPPIGKPYSLDELTGALRVIAWAVVNEGGLSH